MTEKIKIIGCGAVGWTKAIGWLQIVTSAMVLVHCTIMLCQVADVMTELRSLTNSPNGQGKNYEVLFEVICITVTTLGVFFAAILLIGVYQRKMGCLTTWMVVMVIGTCADIAGVILEGKYLNGVGTVSIIRCTASIFMRAFGIWVVSIFKQEIRGDWNLVGPVKGYDPDYVNTV